MVVERRPPWAEGMADDAEADVPVQRVFAGKAARVSSSSCASWCNWVTWRWGTT